MKRVFIISFGISCFVFLFAFSFVQSSSALVLATAYPTLTPIGSTPTPMDLLSAISTECPDGVPVGWGTVTPSTDWLYACSHCLPTGTAVDLSTSTPGATHTPVFGTPVPQSTLNPTEIWSTHEADLTATAVYSLTVTPTPTQSSVCNLDLNGPVSVYNEVMDWNYPGEILSNTFSCSDTGTYLQCSGTVVTNDTLDNQDFWTVLDVPIKKDSFGGSVISDVHIDVSPNCVDDAWFGSNTTYKSVGHIRLYGGTNNQSFNPMSENQPMLFSSVSDEMLLKIRMIGTLCGSNGMGATSLTYDWKIYTDEMCLLTPTPTPTSDPDPCQGSFCGCVSSDGVSNLFELGGGGIVAQTCISTPEISFASVVSIISAGIFPTNFYDYLASVFPLPDAVIDPITFCVRERDYSLYIFGYRMPIEFVVGMIVFLAGIRMFVPSMFSGASVLGRSVDRKDGD